MGMFFNKAKRNYRGETPEQEAARVAEEKALLARRQAAWRPLRGEPLRGAIKSYIEWEIESIVDEKIEYDMNSPLIHYDMDELDIVQITMALEEIFGIDIPEELGTVQLTGNDYFNHIQTSLETKS